MFKNTKRQRQLSDGGLLFKTLVEFMNCWGSGRRSRLFVETMNGEAFMNFSTFLGNPGKCYSKQNKMAAGEETLGNPQSHHDPKLSKKVKRKKSLKKTERDNQRAAEFQKRKLEELSAAAATERSPVSAAAAPSSTPSKEFEFSEPLCENMSSLDSSNNISAIMNLDGNVTLKDENEVVKLSTPQSSDADISPEDSKANAAPQCMPWGCALGTSVRHPTTAACHIKHRAACIPRPNPPSSRVDDSDAEALWARMKQYRELRLSDEDILKLPDEDILKLLDPNASMEEVVGVFDRFQESKERNRKKKKKSCYQQDSRT